MYLITANKVTKSFPKTVQMGAKKMEMITALSFKISLLT